MRARLVLGGIVAAALVAVACTQASASTGTSRAALLPSAVAAPNLAHVEVQTSDGYDNVAAFLAPGASSADLVVFAHYLARANGGSDRTSIITSLPEGRILWYDPARIPPAAPSSTDAPTSTSSSPSSTSTSTPTTSSSPAPTTSPASTTTSPPTASTSTAPASPAGPACGLASAAFCATFDAPHNGGTQTGDLDPVLWGVSRMGSVFPERNGLAPTVSPCGGGAVYAPADVRVCNGQLVESNNDGGTVTNTDIYPKQPFDFAGRTGTVVFDVSADSEGTHAAWPEFAITDTPVPGTRRAISEGTPGASDAPQHAQNAVGFSLAGCGGDPFTRTGIDTVYYVANGDYHTVDIGPPNTACVTAGTSSAMNHIKVMVSQSRLTVFGTDAGGTTLVQLVDVAVPLTFTRGLVWMNDAHYNAAKNALFTDAGGKQQDHAFAWDNLGFDGPKTYRDLGFDEPISGGDCGRSQDNFALVCDSSDLPGTHIVNGVNFGSGTTGARVVFNARGGSGSITVSLNGHTAVAVPGTLEYGFNAYTVLLPTTDAQPGTNNIRFDASGGEVENLSLIMVAAATVP